MSTITTFAFGLGGWEFAILAAFLGLLIFGKRLPETAKSVGQSVKSFKAGLNDIDPRAQIEQAGHSSTKSSDESRKPASVQDVN